MVSSLWRYSALLCLSALGCKSPSAVDGSSSVSSSAGSDVANTSVLPSGELNRSQLPIATPRPKTITEVDPNKAVMPPLFEVKAPENAPNVVVIILDDLGFGGPDSFGGPIQMPALAKLADEGLSYNRFHTVALCAPTRTALRTGRNHHVANMGAIPEIATGFPGNTSVTPNYTASVAEILRLNGYNTAAFGKWHSTVGRDTTVSGPQDQWPTRQGFEKFYGFIGAEDNMFAPTLYDGVSQVEIVAEQPGYHLIDDMTTQTVNWMKQQHAMTPDKPFFVYYASPGVHAPHQIPDDWLDKYKGQFDEGWDAVRQATLERQIEMGVVPEGTTLAQTADSIQAWDSLTDDQRKIYARQAEVFAAFAEYTDYHAGRVVDALDEMGVADNTIVMYISGDNGTSSEGNQTGNWNWNNMLNGLEETSDEQLAHLDEWGTYTTYTHMSVGWAVAFDSPFAFTKQVAGDFGGTRNGMVVRWPAGIKAQGEVRSQFSHVIDIAPTILELANIPEPTHVWGVEQVPMQGTSMAYTFADANAPEQHTAQYFEIIGNRAMYKDGWFARTTIKLPWEKQAMNSIESDDGWQLYNIDEDFSLANDLAAENPEKLAELKQEFMNQAIANHVLPLDTRLLERLLPEVAGRPTLMGDRTSVTLYPGAVNLVEDALVTLKNTSFEVDADVQLAEGITAEGVIFAQGGRFGGWSLYLEDGKPTYTYNNVGEITTIQGNDALGAGDARLSVRFDYDGGGVGKGGDLVLLVDGKAVASTHLESSVPARFSIDEGADVGMDGASNVAQKAIGSLPNSAFNGVIHSVTLTTLPASSEAAADGDAQ